MSVFTQFPGWFVMLCLLAGVVYAGALYFKDRFNRTYGHGLATLLGFFRFVCVSLLAFFLLKPIVKHVNRTIEKPIVVVAQDNSQSMVLTADSTYMRTQWPGRLDSLVQALSENYEVMPLAFGAGVSDGLDSLRFNEKMTDYSALLGDLYNKLSGRNLGAVIIASDGLYNRGANPVSEFSKLKAPVYTIALGDTVVRKDVLLADVAHNRLAFLGNKFPVEITVEGRKAKGEKSILKVSKGDKTLFNTEVVFESGAYFKTFAITLDAAETGLQRYTVSLSPVSNEVTLVNNRKDFFIDVLDDRQKILILAHAPHPDVAALQNALSALEGYQVQTAVARDFKGSLSGYGLVVLHQLPSDEAQGRNLAREVMAKKIPALFVWGTSTDYQAFNELNTGFALSGFRNNFTDVKPALKSDFALFNLDDNARKLMGYLPPLAVPFGEINTGAGCRTLLAQQVGQIVTGKPLIAFNTTGDNKVGLLAGEGFWRWYLTDYQQGETHERIQNLANRVAQYLASKEDKSLFRVTSRSDFSENESVRFEAELYNVSYQPLPDRDISMKLKSADGLEYNYTFSPNGNFYKLQAGALPVGHYTYLATAANGTQVLRERGEFSVSPVQLEGQNTTADFSLLYQLASANDGMMVDRNHTAELLAAIAARNDVAPVSYESKMLNDLINYRWLLALLLALLSAEWLLRKRAGTY